MKEPITKFNFEDAFKALDDIPVPTAEKGIRANRQDLQETMRRVDKFELLFEDFYDVNDSEDMNAASEEREAEVAKAKLARIEKIVDLDAETEDDILPSYVGKIIIQCPQCMTLFYKSPEDIEKDEENPDVVNINETCQHCGNTSGYEIIGKVAEEEAPAEEAMDDFSSELEGEEFEDNGESTEDTNEETSDEGEVDELSAEIDLDELDLEELPEEEEVEESLHNSKALKDAEEESDLKTENESKKLTLNEAMSEAAFDKIIAQISADIIAEVKPTPKIEIGDYYEEANFKDVFVSWEQWDEDNYTDDPAFGDAEKAIIDWIDNNAERYPGFKLNALNDLGYNDYFITINVYTDDVQESLTEDIDEDLDAKLKAHDEYIAHLRTTIEQEEKALEAEKNEQIKTSIQGRIDTLKAELEAALPDAVKVEAPVEDIEATEEETIETEETAVEAPVEENEPEEEVKEALTEGLTEAVESMTDKLNRAWKAAKSNNSPIGVTVVTPVGVGTTNKIKEWSKTVNANVYYVDAKNPDLMANGFDEDMISRPDTIIVIDEFDRAPAKTQKAISDEIGYLDTPVEMVIAIVNNDINADHYRRDHHSSLKQYIVTVENEETTEGLTEASKGISDGEFEELIASDEFKKDITPNEVRSIFSKYRESVADEFEDAEVTVEGETDPVALDVKEKEQLTEDNIFNKSFWHKKGYYEKILTVAVAHKPELQYLGFIPLVKPSDVNSTKFKANKYPTDYVQTPATGDKMIQSFGFSTEFANFQSKNQKKSAISGMKSKFNDAFNATRALMKKPVSFDTTTDSGTTTVTATVEHIWIVLSEKEVTKDNVSDILDKAMKVSDGTVLLLGDFDKASNDFNWDMTAVAGAGIDRIAEHQANGTAYVDDEAEASTEDTEDATKKTGDAEGKPEDAKAEDAEGKTGDAEEKAEDAAEVAAEGEPRDEDDRKLLLSSFVTEKKAFLPIRFSADKKAIMPLVKDPFTDIDVFEKWLRNDLQKYGAILGAPIDTAIILVDQGSTFEAKIQKVPAGIDLTDDILVLRTKEGKTSTRLSAAWKALHRVVASLDITDLDDESFNEKLTESLKAVYENVENFTMTDCSLKESTITVTGDIKFKSGKTRNTSYIFEAVQNPDEVKLTGFNKDLFENGKIDITCQIINESLQVNSLNYSYTVNGALVEGLITK